ncbi:MAG: 4-hydroxyproline epimerase [Proteobacteria bacterium]|nr:4-hydroxyproline epimerase [Pseudomonadota bacterium]MDA1310284.1 4-hydroxyproline epimerase [Pseudomonadota bacterium]
MASHTFFCVDAHTCGNPVRVVAGGAPTLPGASAIERRAYFLENLDWIRTGLMFEPRGHDMMSGSILMPSTRDDCDVGILFIETSGCLPMCGHGTIGTVTVAIERGLATPAQPGRLVLDAPAGRIVAEYQMEGEHVDSVRLTNVPSFLHSSDLEITSPHLGKLTVDVAYGGNFYAIVEPQEGFTDMADYKASELVDMARELRRAMNETYRFVHPEEPAIQGLSHIMWTGRPTRDGADARNAVYYGDKAIDRSPCGTGTSARMAQLAARGRLRVGDSFVHESIIASLFTGRIEAETTVGDTPAIVPSVQGWARVTGLNTIFIDDRDPYAHGFVVV